MILVKIHSTPNGKLVAMCDKDIYGHRFEEGDRELNLETQFYNGEEKSEDEIKDILKDTYVINAVGKESIALLQKLNLIQSDNIITISGVPHAQCVAEPKE